MSGILIAYDPARAAEQLERELGWRKVSPVEMETKYGGRCIIATNPYYLKGVEPGTLVYVSPEAWRNPALTEVVNLLVARGVRPIDLSELIAELRADDRRGGAE